MEYAFNSDITFKPELTETCYITSTDKNGNRVRNEVVLHGTGGYGSIIRDAETGNPFVKMKDNRAYYVRVGSLDELQLFKVVDATGRNGRRNSLALYYMSESDYRKHQFVTDSDDDTNSYSGSDYTDSSESDEDSYVGNNLHEFEFGRRWH